MRNTGILLVLFVMTFVACDKDPKQSEIDADLIRQYVEERNLDAQSTSSGLHYVIEEPGNNEHPDLSSRVYIRYTGKLLNDDQFDSSNGQIVDFLLYELIAGWQEGIPLFGKGGRGTLIVPSHLGYGANSFPGIPANSVLVFDIELVDFQ